MSKRKADAPTTTADSSDESDTDVLNVDFEWFDLQEIDFHGLKLLLRQLFDADSELFDLSELVNVILSQPANVGSTVKVPEDETETKDTDPFAFLSVVSLAELKNNQAIRTLLTYLSRKASSIPSLSSTLTDSSARIGLILTERFINMPSEIVPSMYRMLLNEINTAALEGQSYYNFTHYLIVSKTYREVTSTLPVVMDVDDGEAQPSKKKSKKKGGKAGEGAAHPNGPSEQTFLFHAEDEVWQKYALHCADYEYEKKWAEGSGDSKRAFQEAGIRPFGRVALLEAAKFAEGVAAVERYIGGGEA